MPVRNRPEYCPQCGSIDIKIIARLPDETVCLCNACTAEFSLKPANDLPSSPAFGKVEGRTP